MKTYVINTSLNKTLDSNKLFNLTGYHKIQYMNHPLNKMDICLDTIMTSQNSLGFEPFRIVVVVDFFGFDRIRSPYGRAVGGYVDEPEKVETGIYYPFLEAYLADSLFDKLERNDYHVSECIVCYIVSGEYKRYAYLDTEKKQIRNVLTGSGEKIEYMVDHIIPMINDESESQHIYRSAVKKYREKFGPDAKLEFVYPDKTVEADEADNPEDNPEESEEDDLLRSPNSRAAEQTMILRVTQDGYKDFSLHCTPDFGVTFHSSDYPYGIDTPDRVVSYDAFVDAFLKRCGERSRVRHYYYLSENGSGEVAKAFDTLSLSLYLIRLFEREESMGEEQILIPPIDPHALRNLLEQSFNKICAAEEQAQKNPSKYYSFAPYEEPLRPLTKEEILQVNHFGEELLAVQKEYNETPKHSRPNPESQFRSVLKYANHTIEKDSDEYRKQFNEIFDRYLAVRDDMKERAEEVAANLSGLDTVAPKTEQCPSQEEYDAVVGVQKKNISDRFSRTLGYDLFDVDYSKEKELASQAYIRYFRHKLYLAPSALGDFLCLLLSVLTGVVPYFLYELRYISDLAYSIFLLCAASFATVFLVGLSWLVIPTAVRLAKEKKMILEQYFSCQARYRFAFYQLKQRYDTDLVYVEELRYAIRRIGQLYDINNELNERITQHRICLEEVHDELGRLITNLGDVPTRQKVYDVSAEFDISKPIMAPENKIYKIFSIDAIEELLSEGKDRYL